jgi:diguanylate cyclase (GGDEF)-like protein
VRTVQSVVSLTAAASAAGAGWDDLVAELPVGVLLQDERGVVLAGNRLAAELLGVRHDDLPGSCDPLGRFASDDSGAPLPSCAEIAAQVLRTGSSLTVPVVVARGGEQHVRLWADHHPLVVRGRRRLLVVLHPVHTDVLRSRGLLDPLTGLPGRALLLDRLEQALVRARTCGTLTSLVLLDVRQLAEVNERHGFRCGDELLTALATRLREGLRDDHTVARYGGDEFAVVAEHPNGSGEAVAERVLDLVSRTVPLTGARLRPAVRVCWVTSDGTADPHAVISHVETRLHR